MYVCVYVCMCVCVCMYVGVRIYVRIYENAGVCESALLVSLICLFVCASAQVEKNKMFFTCQLTSGPDNPQLQSEVRCT
jgi:hypothetical protein